MVMKVNSELLKRNRFCHGVKRGKKYVCGDEVNDQSAINNTVDLLIEAISRTLRWQAWDTWWIDRYKDEWLTIRKSIEVCLRNKYSDEIINGILKVANAFIKYLDKFKEYWIKNNIGHEVKRLIEYLMHGKAEIIIWRNKKGISIYSKYVTLNVNTLNEKSIAVHLHLAALEVLL